MCFEYFVGHHKVLALYTYHNNEDYFTEYAITRRARALGIPVHYESITPADIEDYVHSGCDLFFSAEYNRIIELPQNLPQFRGVNIHSSCLPQGRSYYPIECAMERGLPRTGVTLHTLAPKVDSGRILARRSFPVALASVDMSMDIINAQIRQFVGTVTGVIFVVLALSASFFHIYTRKVVMEPLGQLHTANTELVNSQMDHLDQFTNEVKTGDELQELGESFEFMTQELETYIHNLAKATAEKERIGAELDLATRIQANMLPNIFPAFPERPDFDIFASMTPAKEVGGDFYDFFLIDDDHLGMVIADVSGKGVLAALFMMMSMILVNNTARMEGPDASPGAVLTKVNNTICANNSEEMFVTVWLGILTISTGRVVAANAGHEYPMLKKADGSFELFKDRHGLVVGAMEGIRFRDHEFTLEKGGALFVYTDGVAEATDAHDELFGTERTLEALNQNPDASPRELLENVKGAVDRFVGEAPQFDDLTMLSVKRN